MNVARIYRAPIIAGILVPAVYSTTFANDENPLAGFYGGATDGGIFGDVIANGGIAYADRTITNLVNDYEDSLALAKPSILAATRNHYAKGIIKQSGSSSGTHEVELWVGGSPGFTGFEILVQRGSTSPQIIHQDGNKPGWSVLDGTVGRYGTTPDDDLTGFSAPAADGDEIEATIEHDDIAEEATIIVYRNSVEGSRVVIPYASNYYLQGHLPGMGFYVQTGNTPSDYCLASFEAGAL